jgi:hypothetical protein
VKTIEESNKVMSCAKKLISFSIALGAFAGNLRAQSFDIEALNEEKSEWQLRQSAAKAFDEHKLEYVLHLHDVRSLLDSTLEEISYELAVTRSQENLQENLQETSAEDFILGHNNHVSIHSRNGNARSASVHKPQSDKRLACIMESADLSYSGRFTCVQHDLKTNFEGISYWAVGSSFSAAVTSREPIADSYSSKGFGRFANSVATSQEPVQDPKTDFDLGLSSTGVISAKSEKIFLNALNESKNISLPSKLRSEVQGVFVRNAELMEATLGSSHIVLKGLRKGESELFLVTRQGISIVPVVIGATQIESNNTFALKSKPKLIPGDFQIAESMSKLDILDKLVASEAKRASLSASGGDYLKSNVDTGSFMASEANDLVPFTTEMTDIDNSHTSFRHTKRRLDFAPLRLRLVDDRTTPDQSAVYPVGGQIVQLSGSNFQAVSDSKGFVVIPDMPAGARILAQVYDPGGRFAPTVVELAHDDSTASLGSVQWIKLKRSHVLDLDYKMASVTPNANQGSVCLTVVDDKKQGVSGVRIGTNRKVEGVFYFGSRGIVDPKKRETDTSGRVCIFNAEAGGLTLGLAARGVQEMISVTVAVTPGRHLEEEISTNQRRPLTTSVAQLSTATEQLSSDLSLSNRYTVIDGAEIMPIGSPDLMVSLEDGIFATTSDVLPIRGRTWTVSQSGEHELSVQAMPLTEDRIGKPVVTMIPRGFIEDMMYFAQEDHNLDLSSVVVEHAYVEGQSKEPVKIKLIDPFGRDVGKGWYYSDQPVTKAIFFDVPTGVYSVYVESSAGQWIASDTIVTYPQTTTMVHSGAKLGVRQETALRSQ